jgi:phosphatidate cytidylyltransferase
LLKQRIITALILAPAAIWAIFYLSLINFAAVMLVVMVIGAWEWGPLMGFANKCRRLVFVGITSILIATLWHFLPLAQLWHAPKILLEQANIVLWLAAAWWLLSAGLTFLYPRYSTFWSSHRSVRGIFGCLTLIPTWLAFMVLRSSDYQVDSYHGAQLLMFLLLMVWSADVGAYFVGKSIGKRKLLPNVSPGKTLEGFLGGVILACVMVAVAGYIIDWSIAQYRVVIPVTILIATISVLGDLNESMFKRQAGVKNSGTILPGHGGVLDRIDSLTATAPIYALCYVYLGW